MNNEFIKISNNLYRSKKDASRFRFNITAGGTRYSKTFYAEQGTKIQMKEAAAIALDEFRKEKSITNNWFNNLSENHKNITFDEYFTKWVKIKKRVWKNGNSDLVEGTYKNHIKPVLGDLKVNEITPADISSLMDNLKSVKAGAVLSKSARKAILSIVKAIFKKLVNDELVYKSPVKELHEVKRSYREEKTLVSSPVPTFERVKAAIYTLYSDDPKLLAAFLFGLLAGKRLNEVLTLKWTDVNFDDKSFIIRAKNSKINTSLPFTLPDEVIAALKRIKRGRSKFIFSSKETKTGHINSLQHHYKKIRVQSGVSDYNFHYQRNIYVSALSTLGVPDHELASNLGHVDTTQIKTYLTKDRLEISKRSVSVLERIGKI